jgi:cation:H+ antiporter
LTLLFLCLGFAGVVFGADLLVGASIELARRWGASETVIGLTLVAVGTSLPELATSIMAGLRGRPEIALGNVVGSNIFNALGIVGATALVKPLAVPPEIARFDAWVMTGTAVLVVASIAVGWRLGRREGLLLLALYAGYLGVILSPAARPFLGLD